MGGTAQKSATKSTNTVSQELIDETWQRILKQAVRAEASDIHVEPDSDGLVVRYRRHGLLGPLAELPKELARPLARYLKTLAELDTTQTKSPQVGSFTQQTGRRTYQLSVATMPLLTGERLVIHLHDQAAEPPSLPELGLWGASLSHLQQALTQPHGLILVTGPNHSGVSITLASIAAALTHPAHKVVSVEAETAYHVPTVDYMLVRPQTGMTWERVLKLQLKHGADAVVVGALPDRATAELAITSARQRQLLLAGVLADTTVDSITQVARLSGNALGLAASLRVVTNQRLVWHLCPKCRESYAPDAALRQQLTRLFQLDRTSVMKRFHELVLAAKPELGANVETEPGSSEGGLIQLWRAKKGGCRACHGSGYSGAIALFSVLPISDQLRSQVAQGVPASSLRTTVREQSVMSLQADGFIKALHGLIAIESVLSIRP
jgi:type II secretory ATPase GspE/PulE/Tfp pilus assembly ATPase PilB-like protein